MAHLEAEKLTALSLPFLPLAEVLSTAEFEKNEKYKIHIYLTVCVIAKVLLLHI